MKHTLLLLIAMILSSCSASENEKVLASPSCSAFSPIDGKVYNIIIAELPYGPGFVSIENKFLCRYDNKNRDDFDNKFNEHGVMDRCDFLVRAYRVKLIKDYNGTVRGIGKYNRNILRKEDIYILKNLMNMDIDPGNMKFCSV